MYQTKIGHVHLKVRDLDRAIAFYTRFFHLKLTERVGRYAFLSGGDFHHELALQGIGSDAPSPPSLSTGLYHVAFAVPDKRSLALAYQALTTAGTPVSPVDHLISWALYFSDLDGNGLEIYWDTRSESFGARVWQGRNKPLSAEKLLEALHETIA
jgi:catechol 2,3-dioxygenase